MNSLNINILKICETRNVNNGDFVSNKHGIYAGGKIMWWVGLIIHEEMKKCDLGYYQLSDRCLLLK